MMCQIRQIMGIGRYCVQLWLFLCSKYFIISDIKTSYNLLWNCNLNCTPAYFYSPARIFMVFKKIPTTKWWKYNLAVKRSLLSLNGISFSIWSCNACLPPLYRFTSTQNYKVTLLIMESLKQQGYTHEQALKLSKRCYGLKKKKCEAGGAYLNPIYQRKKNVSVLELKLTFN